MGIKPIYLIFLVVTTFFSFVGYESIDVVIAGPQMTEIEYFENEVDEISRVSGIKIKYLPLSDVETYMIENPDSNIDIAILPNPQGVVNLGDRGLLVPINKMISEQELKKNFSKHLLEITTSKKNSINFGVFFRLFPNSLIWYDVQKFKALGSPQFDNYQEMLDLTVEYANKNRALWCLDIESGASTGWIATNWLEDLILHNYGSEVYDAWSSQEIFSSDSEIILSIGEIGKLVFIEGGVYGGSKRVIRKEFRNNFKNLLDSNNDCVFSWSGHYSSYFMPEDKNFKIDYDFFKFPSLVNKNSMVGIGDVLVATNDRTDTKIVLQSLVSKHFGKDWMDESDSTYIPANILNENKISNPMLEKEFLLVHNSLKTDSFRYDASELMERRIGANALWKALKSYIELGKEKSYLEIYDITKDLDSKY